MNDAGHRPHADHRGRPVHRNNVTEGPESIRVTLDAWGPSENVFPAIYDALQANWGDAPSRTVNADTYTNADAEAMAFPASGWHRLSPSQRAYVESCFAGQTLQQVLEGITFNFTIDGVTRAFTHQHVRSRMGAAFMQHGGRDNDWRNRNWTMPETIRRACTVFSGSGMETAQQRWDAISSTPHCLDNPEALLQYLDENMRSSLREQIMDVLFESRKLYAALVDAGIPWQDARRVLPIGTQTYIHDVYNYIALKGMLANRLEFIMDWENNCVAQLMKREVIMKCPPIFGKYLMSHSDKGRKAAYAGLDSWPPDGKWPVPDPTCLHCGHSGANHVQPGYYCEACIRERTSCPGYMPKKITRAHRPEQNPFWVLAPESMAGGPIRWIATNGVFPEEAR